MEITKPEQMTEHVNFVKTTKFINEPLLSTKMIEQNRTDSKS